MNYSIIYYSYQLLGITPQHTDSHEHLGNSSNLKTPTAVSMCSSQRIYESKSFQPGDSCFCRGFAKTVVGCRSGSRYFEGYHNVSRSQRLRKMIFRKYQDSTPIQKLIFRTVLRFTIHPKLSRKYPRLQGFAYVQGLRLSKLLQDFKDFMEIPPSYASVFI